ncbi:MAG: LytR family transcriptional regulator [Ruminococcaceae bacterium]|nr:LytR family transcriptional regulator [Oscillospiraceae bacterium]
MKKTKKSTAVNSGIDIYSSTKRHARHAKVKPANRQKRIIIILVSIIAVLALLFGGAYWYLNDLLNNVNRGETYTPSELGVNSTLEEHEVINIALLGIDTRTESFKGRSDAIIILTIDKEHDKIKMTSIARDSYVEIEDRGYDKLTHAYAYGSARLAMKTINENYDMNITDYVTVNFFGIADIIDEIGGLTVDVDESERYVMNTEYVPELNRIGIPCEKITKTGPQHLTGAQALAYSRNRYSPGGDAARTGRQREILSLMFERVKKMGISKLPGLIKMALGKCETSLTNNEITSMATWALTKSPTIESLSIPDEDCGEKSGDDAFIGKYWYSIYDLNIATQKIHDFIKEEGTYLKSQETTSATN